jgi:hypothetical protein
MREKPTRATFTAFSISSIDISTTMTLRRVSAPAIPITKRMAESPITCSSGIMASVEPPLGQHHGPHDGGEQQE